MLQFLVKCLLILAVSQLGCAMRQCMYNNKNGAMQWECVSSGEPNLVIKVSPNNGAVRVDYKYKLASGLSLLCDSGFVYKMNINRTKWDSPNYYPIPPSTLGITCDKFTLSTCTIDGIVVDCSMFVSINFQTTTSPPPVRPAPTCSSTSGATCDDKQPNRCCKNSGNTLFCLSTQKCGTCEALNVQCGPGPYNAPCCGDASCIIPATSGADVLQPAVCTTGKCAKFNESCNTDGTNNCCAPYMCNQYFTPQKQHVFFCGSPLPYCVARNQNTYFRGQPDDVSVCTGTSKLPARCCSGVCVPARNGTSPPPASATFGTVVGDASAPQPTGVCSCSLKGGRCDSYSSCCSTSQYSCGSDFKCIY